MRVTDKIGKEYEQWQPGDSIFISTPTGSGKTYFVLHELLAFAKRQQKKVLYLVNRSILKEQLEREIFMLPAEERTAVKIELYQTIERSICNSHASSDGLRCYPIFGQSPILIKMVMEYDYIVCDECHYFLMDSNYNTYTWLSFRWIQEYFRKKIRIFLSATIEEIEEYIVSDDEKMQYQKTPIYGFHTNATVGRMVVQKQCGKKRNYSAECDYSYLKIGIINKRDQTVDLVCDDNNSGKWLIFVDSIDTGKKLQKMIRDKSCKKDVVFLSSGYKREGGAPKDEVESIRNENIQSASILITTSVMDNGISIKDEQLKNLVVLADNKTEFIQMIGRARKNENQQINLYLCSYSENHFRQRIRRMEYFEDVALKYWQESKEKIEEPLIRQANEGGMINWKRTNIDEVEFMTAKHIELLNRFINEDNMYEKIKIAFYDRSGILLLNPLSIQQMDNLKCFYNQMIVKFEEEGENVFVKEQLRWLGKTEEEIDGIICESEITAEEKSRKALFRVFEATIDKPMKEEEAIDFKTKVRDDLLVLMQSCEAGKEKEIVERNLKKLDRVISSKNMKYFEQNCGLPYCMKVTSNEEDGETYYTLKRINE